MSAPEPPPALGFRAKCWTCEKTPEGDGLKMTYPGGYTFDEVDTWAYSHQCKKDIVVSPPRGGRR